MGEAIRRGYKEYFGQVLPNLFVSEITVEQNHGTPESISENSKKPLQLSGNIAWENRTEDADNYLEDRFNDLLER